MTTIRYRINNQTARDITADDWESAKTLQAQTQAEEMARFGFWNAIAEVTNNDGSITQCSIDENGTPMMYDAETNAVVPYVDNT